MKTKNKMIEQRIEQGNNTRKEILQSIIEYIEEHGYSPSYEEIGELTGKARVTIHRHIHIMLEEGLIETDSEFTPRAIRVPGYKFTKVDPVEVTLHRFGDGDEVINCPSCGKTYFAEDWGIMNFCPNCGQGIKVVKEA